MDPGAKRLFQGGQGPQGPLGALAPNHKIKKNPPKITKDQGSRRSHRLVAAYFSLIVHDFGLLFRYLGMRFGARALKKGPEIFLELPKMFQALFQALVPL